MKWLIFLSQLHTNPSSLRVTTWRKMRAAGALGLQNSAWIMLHTLENEKFLQDLLAAIQQQDAGGQIFKVMPLTEDIEKDLVGRFQVERDNEYTEFCGRCKDFLAEIEKETKKKKFIFAELEEIESDLEKMIAWLKKIQEREFSQTALAEEAVRLMETCRSEFEGFSQAVYAYEKVTGQD